MSIWTAGCFGNRSLKGTWSKTATWRPLRIQQSHAVSGRLQGAGAEEGPHSSKLEEIVPIIGIWNVPAKRALRQIVDLNLLPQLEVILSCPEFSHLWRKKCYLLEVRTGRCSPGGNAERGFDPSPGWRRSCPVKWMDIFDSDLGLNSFSTEEDWGPKSTGHFFFF